jgi:hypothetical protein
MITERNGIGQARGLGHNSPGHVHSGGGAGPVAHVTPDVSGPPSWPAAPVSVAPVSGVPVSGVPVSGVESVSAGASVPSPREEGPGDAEPDFWDWAPDEPDAGLADDPRDPSNVAQLQAPPVTPVPVGTESVFEEVPRTEGIGFRFSSLSHIFGHNRVGMWRRRILIAVAIFVLCDILLNWQVGVTLAVLAVIGDTILRARSAPSAPSVAGTRKLTKPQRMTQKQLAGLEKAGYRALHSRLIPDSEEHIDHLVIGPAGVFSIDSEWWDKHLPIRTKNARQLWLGPFSMKERLEHARWESDQAAALISGVCGMPVSVRPVMAVYGPKIPWDVTTIREVDVFSGKRLRIYLRRYARHNTARPLGETDIERIYRCAHAALPQLDPGISAPPLPPTG